MRSRQLRPRRAAKQRSTNPGLTFTGKSGKRRLRQVVEQQTLVSGDAALASLLIKAGTIRHYNAGESLSIQNASDNDLFLLLSGAVAISVNGRDIATREAGTHVGELALVDSLARRSATITATERVTAMRITEDKFSRIADDYPILWRRIAVEIARRLRDRNRFIRTPNDQPILFIGSSTEGLPVATGIRDAVQGADLIVRLWSDGVFETSRTFIESLVELSKDADCAALLLTADDITVSRGKKKPSPRDNVIFEIGLLMGALGRERVFVLLPKGTDLRLPSDLLGVTCVPYVRRGPKPLAQRLAPCCARIRADIDRLGRR